MPVRLVGLDTLQSQTVKSRREVISTGFLGFLKQPWKSLNIWFPSKNLNGPVWTADLSVEIAALKCITSSWFSKTALIQLHVRQQKSAAFPSEWWWYGSNTLEKHSRVEIKVWNENTNTKSDRLSSRSHYFNIPLLLPRIWLDAVCGGQHGLKSLNRAADIKINPTWISLLCSSNTVIKQTDRVTWNFRSQHVLGVSWV